MKYNGIYYEIRRKKGPWLVFIHGAGSNHSVWKPVFEHFSKKHSVLTMDLRNHGHSDRGETSISQCSEDIAALLQKETITKAILIGNSLGATIAYHLHQTHKKLASKLILITPFSLPIIRGGRFFYLLATVVYTIMKSIRSKRKLRFQDFHKYQEKPLWYYPLLDLRGTSLTTYSKVIKDLFAYHLDFTRIEIPCLIITGKHDIMSRHRYIRKQIKGKDITMTEINSHHTPLTRTPAAIIQTIESFVP